MRLIAFFVTVIVALVLLTDGAHAQPKKLQFLVKDALEKSETFELFSLDPKANEKAENFQRWNVLGKTSVKDAATRKKLIDALVKGVAEGLPKGAVPLADPKLFDPYYGIRVVHDGKTMDVVLGFHQFEGRFFVNNKDDGGFLISKSAQETFDKVLKDADVKLAEPPTVVKEPVRLPDEPLPGFPNIIYNATLLQVPDKDGKPLLKIVKKDYDKDKKEISWLVELQIDITYDLFVAIHRAWQNDDSTAAHGPSSYFFDKDRVFLYSRDLKEVGQLRNGRKGDRIRLVLDVGDGFPNAASMEIRRP